MTATSVVPPPMSTIMLPVGSVIGQAGTDCRRHRLLDDEDLARARLQGGVLHGALLDLRDVGRNGDDDLRAHEERAAVRLLDEVVEHPLRDLEVGDDAVLHGPDRDDVAGRAAEHLLGGAADGLDLVGDLVDGHDRGLADDDAAALREHEGVRRAEIDREVGREDREERAQGQGAIPFDVRGGAAGISC